MQLLPVPAEADYIDLRLELDEAVLVFTAQGLSCFSTVNLEDVGRSLVAANPGDDLTNIVGGVGHLMWAVSLALRISTDPKFAAELSEWFVQHQFDIAAVVLANPQMHTAFGMALTAAYGKTP